MNAHTNPDLLSDHDATPVTSEWLDAQTFAAWDLTGLAALTDEEWAAAANPNAFLLRFSLEAMGKTKEQLASVLLTMGVSDSVALIEGLEESAEWFERSAQLLRAAQTRLYAAAASLELRPAPAAA